MKQCCLRYNLITLTTGHTLLVLQQIQMMKQTNNKKKSIHNYTILAFICMIKKSIN